MRRLFAAAVAAAALVVVPGTAQASHYGLCGGVVDIQCTGRVCPTDCWTYDCLVWVDLLHNSNTAQCVRERG